MTRKNNNKNQAEVTAEQLEAEEEGAGTDPGKGLRWQRDPRARVLRDLGTEHTPFPSEWSTLSGHRVVLAQQPDCTWHVCSFSIFRQELQASRMHKPTSKFRVKACKSLCQTDKGPVQRGLTTIETGHQEELSSVPTHGGAF